MPYFDITRICNYNEYFLVEADSEEVARTLVWSGEPTPYYTSDESGDGELLVDEITEEKATNIRKEHKVQV